MFVVKLLYFTFTSILITGCVSVYPPVSENLYKGQTPLDVELNIDCFAKFRNWSTLEEEKFSREIDKSYCTEFVRKLQFANLFRQVTTGDQRFFEKNQVAVRIVYPHRTYERYPLFVSGREYQIRWQGWNLNGLVFDFTETFHYRDRSSVRPEIAAQWQMKLAEKARAALRDSRLVF